LNVIALLQTSWTPVRNVPLRGVFAGVESTPDGPEVDRLQNDLEVVLGAVVARIHRAVERDGEQVVEQAEDDFAHCLELEPFDGHSDRD
jgi:hypothetical protein